MRSTPPRPNDGNRSAVGRRHCGAASVGRRARESASLHKAHKRRPEANTTGYPAAVRMVGILAGSGRLDAVRGRRRRTGGGQGGRPLAQSRRQTNRGSNGRRMCSCAFPIGNSKRLRFIRTHTCSRANSRRMMARGGCPDDRSYCPKRRRASRFSWRMDTIPQNEEPPGARKRRSTCTSAASARGRHAEGDGLGGVFPSLCDSSSLGLDARSGRST